jgi:hypothetical protein
VIFGKRITKIEKIKEIKKPIGVSNDTNSSCKKAQYKVNNVSFKEKGSKAIVTTNALGVQSGGIVKLFFEDLSLNTRRSRQW